MMKKADDKKQTPPGEISKTQGETGKKSQEKNEAALPALGPTPQAIINMMQSEGSPLDQVMKGQAKEVRDTLFTAGIGTSAINVDPNNKSIVVTLSAKNATAEASKVLMAGGYESNKNAARGVDEYSSPKYKKVVVRFAEADSRPGHKALS